MQANLHAKAIARIALVWVLLLPVIVRAQSKEPSVGRKTRPSAPKIGILLLAHGGKANWNQEVSQLAAHVDPLYPVAVAFGMASRNNIQEAIDRLIARGVREIIAVPLFVSSHSSVITATQYLLGLRDDAPPELARYAKMDHSHGAYHVSHTEGQAVSGTMPVHSPVPIHMAAALDRHPRVADILLSRAQSLSQDPAREVVVLVAHGPVSDQDNARWLADMAALRERMRDKSRFRRIEYLTVRDDAPEPIRSQATAELRAVVKRACGEGHHVLIVPLLISYGGIEEGIKKRLAGLRYTMSPQALLPDDRLARWVLEMAESVPKNGRP